MPSSRIASKIVKPRRRVRMRRADRISPFTVVAGPLGHERRDRTDARAVLVAEREVEEEVERRLDAGLGELLRARGADARKGGERGSGGSGERMAPTPC